MQSTSGHGQSMQASKKVGLGNDTPAEKVWDRWLVLALVFLTPLTLLGLSFYGVTKFESTLTKDSGAPIAFRGVEAPEEGWDPRTAREALRLTPEISQITTRLSERPFYFEIDLRGREAAQNLYLASGHADRVRCWSGDERLLGAGDRSGNLDRVLRTGVGFVLPVDEAARLRPILCEARFQGPAQVVFFALSNEQLRGVSDRYHRLFGGLEGGMLMLVLFLLITGLLNRERVYGVFAIWVIANWRLSEQILGTGADVFTMRLPGPWIVPVALFTILFFLVANFALFITLFKEEIERVDRYGLIRGARLIVLVEILFFLFAPIQVFVVSVWLASGLGVGIMIALILRMIPIEKSGVALLYGGLLLAALLITLYLVVSEALGIKGYSGVIFGVTNSLLASVMAILMVASKLQKATASSKALSVMLAERYETTPLGLFTVSPEGQMSSTNEAFRRLFGSGAQEGATWRLSLGAAAWDGIAEAAKQPGQEITISVHADGDTRHYGVRVNVRNGAFDGVIRDMTSEVLTERRKDHLARHDGLTGLLNAEGLDLAIESLRKEVPADDVWLIAIDLDRLASINEMFGHAVGDKVLTAAAQRLQGALPERSAVARLGGDQFIAVVMGTPEEALRAGTRCVESIRGRNLEVGGVSVSLLAYAGLSDWPQGLGIEEIKPQAEYACRKASREGVPLLAFDGQDRAANSLRVARAVASRMEVMPGLRDLQVGLLPIVQFDPESVQVNMEVVPLLPAPGGGFVPDEAFQAGVELWGSMDAVDVWRMKRAFAVLRELDRGFRGWAAITLSGAALSNALTARQLVTLVQSNIEFAHRLLIRVPARSAARDPAATRAAVADFRRYQCKVVYCDAGSAEVPLKELWEFDVDGYELAEAVADGVPQGRSEWIQAESVRRASERLGRWLAASSSIDADLLRHLAGWGVRYVRLASGAMPYNSRQTPQEMLQAIRDRAQVKELLAGLS